MVRELVGGINHQIEHPLVPTLSASHFKRIQPIVQRTFHPSTNKQLWRWFDAEF